MTKPQTEQVSWHVVLGIMVCFAVMMSASYTMLIPFLPIYLAEDLGADPASINLWSGVIFAVSFAISAVVSPLWGKLSDRTGRKPMILRASILLSLSYFLGGLVHTPLQLFLVRVLQGFASGLWPACLALLSAYVPQNRIGIAMGLMQSANITGGIIGPLLGGILATVFGMRNSFFVGASALMAITVITVFFIREPPRDDRPKTDSGRPAGSSNLMLLRNRGILTLLVAAGLTNMVILQIQPVMTLYIRSLSGTDENNLMLLSGIVFSLGGLAGALAAPLWGRTGQRTGFYKTMIAAFITAGIITMLQAVPESLKIFALLQFCVGLAFSGIFPSANSILILITPMSSRGAGFGLFFAAQQVGGAIGPLLGGFLATLLPLFSIFIWSGIILFSIGLWLLLAAPQSIRIKPGTGSQQAYLEDVKREARQELNQRQSQDAAGSQDSRR